MELIDKSAVIAEIERLKSIQFSIFSKGESIGRCYDSLTYISVYNEILSFLDTFEVKKVDLDAELEHYKAEQNIKYEEDINMFEFARHFFELGLKARKGE